MNDDVTACAATIARTLAQRDTDPNELAKVATYLRPTSMAHSSSGS
jgi:hypothetical protein